jgi:hypothetical protein
MSDAEAHLLSTYRVSGEVPSQLYPALFISFKSLSAERPRSSNWQGIAPGNPHAASNRLVCYRKQPSSPPQFSPFNAIV